jgi:hypothetical protein
MRHALFMIALLLLTATAAVQAQDNNDSTIPNQRFGTAVCHQKITCDFEGLPTYQLAANANACLTESFGLNTDNGYFEETMPLDSNNCLTVKSDYLSGSNAGQRAGRQIIPVCCIVALPDSTCTFHCDLMGGH